MRTYLIYSTEADAKNTEKYIWLKAIKVVVADDRFLSQDGRAVERKNAKDKDFDTKGKIIDRVSGKWVDGEKLSDDELNDRSRFPLMYSRGDKLDRNAISHGWDKPRQIEIGEHQGLWCILSPVGKTPEWESYAIGIPEPLVTLTIESKELFIEAVI